MRETYIRSYAHNVCEIAMRGGRGFRGQGAWPGNGPFSHLPPWERPGWLYGRGSCWALGYWGTTPGTTTPTPVMPSGGDLAALQRQKEILASQLESVQQSLSSIEERIRELERKDRGQ
jgi:hypothetical protein